MVAAAWATIAGWIRIVGQVTPVPRRRRSVAAAIAPMTLHTNGLCPWRSIHGWKWSEIERELEARLLGTPRVAYKVERRVLLARQRVPDLHGRCFTRVGRPETLSCLHESTPGRN